MRNKKIFVVTAILSVIAIIVVLLYFAKPITQELKSPTDNQLQESSKQNKTLEIQDELNEKLNLTSGDSGKKSATSFGGGGGAGGAGGADGTSGTSTTNQTDNDVPGASACPSSLNVEYLIDYKSTTTPTDDDVYLGIRNNNQLPDFINIRVEDYNEGDIEIKGLGLSIKHSAYITNWWRPLNVATTRSFNLLLTSETCLPISSVVIVVFPPSEGDYLD